MLRIGFQANNGRRPLATFGNLKLACVELGISDDKHTVKRAARAFDLYKSEKVEHVNDHTFNVKSQYTNRLPYQVWISPTGTSYCTCPDWMNYSGDMVLPDVHFHCKHAISARIWLHHNGNGNGSKIENEAKVKYRNGSQRAAEIEAKLNGDNGSDTNNGTGDNSSPVSKLDANDPFQEAELLDIEQIEGRSNGDLVYKLNNGEYVISYRGVMKLAEQHNVTFEASRHDETHTVIAQGRCGNNSRASGKPINGSEMTAIELAKRNAARQLLPLPEIKALEHKVKLECEFNWEVAKRKCLEVLPEANLNCIIYDLIRDDKLREAHPSDYKRKEWLLIYDTVKADAETNGGAGDTASSPDKFEECRTSAKDFVRFNWLKADMLKEGVVSGDWTDDDFAKLKSACEIDASLFGKQMGHFEIDLQPNANQPWRYDRRYRFWLMPMSRRCFWCAETEGVMPDTVIKWGRYEIKTSLCLECSEKVGDGELDKDRIVGKFDEVYRAYGGVGRSNIFPDDVETVPSTEAEFVERCKQAEADVVDDTTDDPAPAPMVEDAQMDDKRKLQMDKKKNIVLIEPDGTQTPITMRDTAFTYGSNYVLRLTQGIACGGDISTVELDN